jgi:hypothetical protein
VSGYRPDRRNHLSSLFVKKFRVHETLIAAPSERGGELSSRIKRFDTSTWCAIEIIKTAALNRDPKNAV